MSISSIDFSAEFGGRDAAAAVLPHFNALKAAARGVHLEGFPFAKLAYILRVDGEVNQYGLSGVGNLDIDKDGEYLSVDIGVKREDREEIAGLIAAALLSSIDQVKSVSQRGSFDVDFDALQRSLFDLNVRYKNELAHSARTHSNL
jgi:hypothetical protein